MFKPGDRVWHVRVGKRDLQVPCTVCMGKKVVTLILGDDTPVVTPCGFCGNGYEGPRGYTVEFGRYADCASCLVVAVDTHLTAGAEEVRYKLDDGHVADPADLFDERVLALLAAEGRSAEAEAEDARRAAFVREEAIKKFAWHVGYHRREASKLRKKIEFHERQAVVFKALAVEESKQKAGA